MSNPVTVKIHGLDILQRNLESLRDDVAKKGIRDSLKAGGTEIKNEMAVRAPDRTGFMRQSFNVKIKMRGKGDLAGSAFIGINSKARYPKGMAARVLGETLRLSKKAQKAFLKQFSKGIPVMIVGKFLEWGTSRMPKRPFMTAAFKSSSERALSAVKRSLLATIQSHRYDSR
jgi:HK97 gp10 family phage protein